MELLIRSRPRIRINLEPGIYVFPNNSAIGKTYLCSLLKSLSGSAHVTAHSFPDVFHPEDVFDNEKRDVVLLDRYDMRSEDYATEMQKFAQHGSILVDCKSNHFPLPFKTCVIRMYRDELMVK